MQLSKRSGLALLEMLLTFPILLLLLSLSAYLFTYYNKTLRLLEAYYFMHDNARVAQYILRKELKDTHTPLEKKHFYIASAKRYNARSQPISAGA